MKIAIVGGGIGGLSLALQLHARGIECEIYEATPEVREEVGVGITLLPHAMREIASLGLQEQVEALGIENLESVFFNRWGQFVYREPRGRHGGYELPEIGIHRGKLHGVLYRAVLERIGAEHVHLGHRCTWVTHYESGASLMFVGADGKPLPTQRADAIVACDGINSAVREQFNPGEQLAFAGTNTWRGVSVHPPILTGKSYLRIGSIETGKMVIYPIADDVDGQGNQLINWVAEIQRPGAAISDWNRGGSSDDFIETFEFWKFDWLDVPALIRGAQRVFEYPMVDRDPIARWTHGRVTLLGDAAHPMYPRGSNGVAQAMIDARMLAADLAAAQAHDGDPRPALERYQQQRLEPTAKIVRTNRTVPPDFIIMKADELSGGRPFRNIHDLISQEELRRISDTYKDVAGFSLAAVSGWPAPATE